MISTTLCVIPDDFDYDAVVERITQIFDAIPGTPRGKELEILLSMLDKYQKSNGLLPEVEPAEVIQFIMEQQGLTLQDIAVYFGGEEMASQILLGRKTLTPQMIQSLSIHLHIPIEALV